MIAYHPEQESILLKDRNKNLIEYEDTSETFQMRAVLRDYNQLLARTHIACSSRRSYLPEADGRSGGLGRVSRDTFIVSLITAASKAGVCWQFADIKHRSRIRINGERCVEVDYSTISDYSTRRWA